MYTKPSKKKKIVEGLLRAIEWSDLVCAKLSIRTKLA